MSEINLQEWLEEYGAGYYGSKDWSIKWISDCKRFILLHIPGGTFWDGMMNRYSPVEFKLIDMSKPHKGMHRKKINGVCFASFEGLRFSKKFISTVKMTIELYKKKEESK